MSITDKALKLMRERAEQWTKPVPGASGAIVTRDNALGEENMALDVIELVSEVRALRESLRYLRRGIDGYDGTFEACGFEEFKEPESTER